MSIIKQLQNHFHDMVNSLQGGGIDFLGALWKGIESSGGQILRDAAIAAVMAAEADGGTGEDKFKAAYASVVGVLGREGLPILAHIIRGAIEAAVAQLRAA